MISFSCNSDDIKKILQSFHINKIEKSSLCFNFIEDCVFISSKSRDVVVTFKFYPFSIKKEGKNTSFYINYIMLFNAIKDFNKNQEIEFIFSENEAKNDGSAYGLKIISKNSKITLGISDDELIEEEASKEKDLKNELKISFNKLINFFQKVSNCISNQSERPGLSGLLIHKDSETKDKLSIVGTDGRRLALIKYNFNQELKKDLLISKKIFEQLSSFSNFIDEKDDEISIKYDDQKFSIKYKGNFSIDSSFISSKFPDYKPIIPKKQENYIDFKTEDLFSSLKRANNIAINSSSEAVVNFIIQKEKEVLLKLKSNSSEFEETIDSSKNIISEEEISIFCYSKSILDIISNIKEKDVRFIVNDSKSPILIKPLSTDDFELIYVMALMSN